MMKPMIAWHTRPRIYAIVASIGSVIYIDVLKYYHGIFGTEIVNDESATNCARDIEQTANECIRQRT